MTDRKRIQQEIADTRKSFNRYYKIGPFNIAEFYKDRLIKLYKELDNYDEENN